MKNILDKVNELLSTTYVSCCCAVIVRLDIQYNYIEQQHYAYLKLSNGDEYRIDCSGEATSL